MNFGFFLFEELSFFRLCPPLYFKLSFFFPRIGNSPPYTLPLPPTPIRSFFPFLHQAPFSLLLLSVPSEHAFPNSKRSGRSDPCGEFTVFVLFFFFFFRYENVPPAVSFPVLVIFTTSPFLVLCLAPRFFGLGLRNLSHFFFFLPPPSWKGVSPLFRKPPSLLHSFRPQPPSAPNRASPFFFLRFFPLLFFQ